MRRAALACIAVALPLTALADTPAPKTVVAIVIEDEPMAAATRSTIELSIESALKQDDRIRVLDRDLQLAERAGAVPRDAIAEARGLLATGERLLQKGRAGEALARLIPAEAQLERLLAHVSKRELARTQYLIGVAHAVKGKRDEARRAFVRLLTWRRGHPIDTKLEPGKVIPIWEDAKRDVAALPTSTIRVRAAPSSALAYVDGEFVGFTPTSKKDLTVGTHYVTVRADGRQRQVRTAVIEPDRNTHVRVELERSPHADELDAAVEQVGKRLGDRTISAPMQKLHELLAVDHAVFVTVSGAEYEAYVYELRPGKRIGHATMKLGERDDPEAKFVELAEALYAQVFRVELEPDEPPRKDRPGGGGPAFYEKWWFWTGVGAVATAVAVPLLWPDGDDAPSADTCPAGHVCGELVFSW